MDEIAAAIGIDPIELRRRNFLHDGDTNATEQVMREPVILDQLLDRALRRAITTPSARSLPRESDEPVKRGMGIAAFYHGSGFTGSGERYLNSLAGVDVTPEGKVRVLVSNTEFGQGTNTILTQIAAEALGIDYDDVIDGAARHRHRSQQRAHGCFAHIDGGRPLIERACLQLARDAARTCRAWRTLHARGILRRLRALSRRAWRSRIAVPL
jgi:xanthine dehydrogenase molybdopterin-binding subunit B